MPVYPKLAAAVVAAGLVAACDSADPPPPEVAPDTCGASMLQDHVGASADDLILPETAGSVRIIAPDTAVTMDFNPARLNVETDDAGTVERIYCG